MHINLSFPIRASFLLVWLFLVLRLVNITVLNIYICVFSKIIIA